MCPRGFQLLWLCMEIWFIMVIEPVSFLFCSSSPGSKIIFRQMLMKTPTFQVIHILTRITKSGRIAVSLALFFQYILGGNCINDIYCNAFFLVSGIFFSLQSHLILIFTAISFSPHIPTKSASQCTYSQLVTLHTPLREHWTPSQYILDFFHKVHLLVY